MNLRHGCWLLVGFHLSFSSGKAQEAQIVIHADQPTHSISRYLTGACIEDVNHEIYGGLYSQMIFGESFQEPALCRPLNGFTALGGSWVLKDGALRADAGDGPKLISREPCPVTGEVGVEVLLPQKTSGNAGLLLNVSEEGVGADRFIGYEISLDSAGQLVLGRHRHNWEPLRNVPCEVPTDRWISLAVRLAGSTLEVLVDGTHIVTWNADRLPLTGGRVGLRTWQREACFRNLYLKSSSQTRFLPFEHAGTNTAFEVSGMWRPLLRGSAIGDYSLDRQEPFVGRQSQRLSFRTGQGEVGIENQGLNRWGMSFVKGKRYEGSIWFRSEKPAQVFLALESGDGAASYAETRVDVTGRQWQRFGFKLTPNADDRAGRFAIKLKQPSSVCVGYALLQPGQWGRFKGLPVRKDVAEALQAQGITVLRYGGSMINHCEYRWKKMIGPPERRTPCPGTWYAHSSNGWAIFDFLNFCEAADFLGIPALNADETQQDMADFIEYANAPAASEWGRRRAADGHRAPYRLKYLELGNEEAVNEAYWRKFKPLAEAIWSRDTNIVLVVGDFAYNQAIKDPYNFAGAPLIKSLAVHKKILDLARQHNREVCFDVHIGTENPPAPYGLPGVRTFIEQLGLLSPGARFKVAIFEFNANNHALKRALANACAVNQIERLGDRIGIACSANCLQPYRQNDNGWNQGLLFLSPSQVWPQPPYFVTQMISRNFMPLNVKAESRSPRHALDVAATKSADGKTLVLQVVNMDSTPISASIFLPGFAPRKSAARATILTGDWEATNTPEEPNRVKPVATVWPHGGCPEGVTTNTFPPRSFTVLRLE